ncbi:hypothetical protein ABTL20_20920, partial [Acinetobacter baumannii]
MHNVARRSQSLHPAHAITLGEHHDIRTSSSGEEAGHLADRSPQIFVEMAMLPRNPAHLSAKR